MRALSFSPARGGAQLPPPIIKQSFSRLDPRGILHAPAAAAAAAARGASWFTRKFLSGEPPPRRTLASPRAEQNAQIEKYAFHQRAVLLLATVRHGEKIFHKYLRTSGYC